MACISDRYQNRITKLEASIGQMYDALDKVNSQGVESATFDTGTWGARQHHKNLDPTKILKNIRIAESQLDRYYRLCSGSSLMRQRNRRM